MKTSLPGPSLIILGSRPLYKAKMLEPGEKEHKHSYSEHAMDLHLNFIESWPSIYPNKSFEKNFQISKQIVSGQVFPAANWMRGKS